MGHISPEVAWKLVDKGFVTGVRLETTPTSDPFFCESCVYAKATCKPVAKAWKGNMLLSSVVKSIVTCGDQRPWLRRLNLLRKKDETFDSYKEYEAWCDMHLDVRIKVFHSDRGGEYCSRHTPAQWLC